MTISREDVEHVARLARLELTDEEIERFRGQLDVVLQRAQRIQSLDLDDVPPTARPVERTNAFRPDEVVQFDAVEEILRSAPNRQDAFFAVPQILEDEE